MKKLKYLILFIFALIPKIVFANDIKSITMDIFIDDNGDALVKEVWRANLNNGTEGYKPYYNLGKSEIENFKVSMDGRTFTSKSNWNTEASFDSKKYSSGLNYTSDGVELCFGISKYGDNTYNLEYTITNFVAALDDADMVYWQLIPYDLSDKPEYVYIKIHSNFTYANDLDVWGYGYGDKFNEGYAYVYNGYIEMTKEGNLDSDEYMTVLIKFPKGTFKTSNTINKNFDYYLDMAEEGSDAYHNRGMNFVEVLLVIGAFLVNCIPFIICVVVFVLCANNSKYGTKRLVFSKGSKKVKDAPYFRDLPCKDDIFEAYWFACQYNLVKNNTDFLGAILLKWLKNKNISNVAIDSKNKALKLENSSNLSDLELEIYNMMYEASKDGVLEENEFTSWCKKHYSEILNWFNKAIDDVTMNFVAKGLITEEKKGLFTKYIVSDNMKEKALQMAGLKNFLKDFSNIQDRSAIEVHLWDEYLMYAQIYGIAKEVAKEFKRLYPDILTDEYYNDVIFIHNISYTGVHAASVAKSRAESYSSGGGGFSSSGGGGGSFGGGGGGGGFR